MKRHDLTQRWATLIIYDSLRDIKRPSDISQMLVAQGMMGMYSLFINYDVHSFKKEFVSSFHLFPTSKYQYRVSTWFQELQKGDLEIYP